MDIKIIASGSTGNAYRINDGQTTLLLDAGIPYKQIQVGLDFNIRSLNGVLITHSHKDHSKAASDMLKAGVDIYTSSGTIEACKLTGHRIHAVKALEEFTIGTMKVLPFDVQHDAPEPLGFLITSIVTGEKFLYFTDTYYLKYKFTGLTYILGECNYSIESMNESIKAGYTDAKLAQRIIKSHMSLEHFIDFLKANDISSVSKIYLLHLSDNNSCSDKFCEAIRALTGIEVYVC